jgi:hypothetical protein
MISLRKLGVTASLLASLILSGCVITQTTSSKSANLAAYYLWLTQLTPEQLEQEFDLQKERSANKNSNAKLALAILYSYPEANFHNPYTAKSILNQYTTPNSDSVNNSIIHLPAEDLAFLSMLKEQLNQQLLALQNIVSKEQKIHLMHQKIKQQSKTNEALRSTIQEHKLNLATLKEQLAQLKTIENEINKRGAIDEQ